MQILLLTPKPRRNDVAVTLESPQDLDFASDSSQIDGRNDALLCFPSSQVQLGEISELQPEQQKGVEQEQLPPWCVGHSWLMRKRVR